jgi:hypothetical protein
MTRRTGSADLPLHGGHVPHWLSARMARLGALTDRRAARKAQIDLLTTLGPDGITKEVAALNGIPKTSSAQPLLPHLIMPEHHDVRSSDVVGRRLRGSLAAAASCGPRDFPRSGAPRHDVVFLALSWQSRRPGWRFEPSWAHH